MSKSLSYNRHGFTLFLLSICLMLIVFLGITLTTILNGDYVKKVISSDENVSLIRSYSNQKINRLVNSYSSVSSVSTNLSRRDVKKIIGTSVDEVYDDDSKLTVGSSILDTIGGNLKRASKKQGLNIDAEINQTISVNKDLMNQMIDDDLGPINNLSIGIKRVRGIVKMIVLTLAIIFVLLAIRLRAKVGSSMLFFHHLGTVGICTSILLAILLAFIYFPIQDLISSNIEYNLHDVLYNVLNGIFLSYISIVFMVFILSLIDWGSTMKYKY
ncbi:hypothetical protein FC72_GL000563 [Companilactobacillus tucceti DSM 20183]|uniref:Cell division protein FtsX n=1 Tax=Companilactobacillus tucceti DSM 20183 TaxID=1423811 RepID=A0A0R1IZG8_9LACO|nr:hypothetical protein [Companilactobacillus tucceti]KRK64251.1 hypothetical protein FC72_GL000563 [Companilactobacillus tucceti DSM 20183]